MFTEMLNAVSLFFVVCTLFVAIEAGNNVWVRRVACAAGVFLALLHSAGAEAPASDVVYKQAAQRVAWEYQRDIEVDPEMAVWDDLTEEDLRRVADRVGEAARQKAHAVLQ